MRRKRLIRATNHTSCSPGERSATGDSSRMAAQAPYPGYQPHQP
ncbi:hypothetical protein [Kluyvera intermedia]|nr:hypothetical protein [Kluyvera intermedia]